MGNAPRARDATQRRGLRLHRAARRRRPCDAITRCAMCEMEHNLPSPLASTSLCPLSPLSPGNYMYPIPRRARAISPTYQLVELTRRDVTRCGAMWLGASMARCIGATQPRRAPGPLGVTRTHARTYLRTYIRIRTPGNDRGFRVPVLPGCTACVSIVRPSAASSSSSRAMSRARYPFRPARTTDPSFRFAYIYHYHYCRHY